MPKTRISALSLLLPALLTWGCASVPSTTVAVDVATTPPCDCTRRVERGDHVELWLRDGSRIAGWADEVQPDALYVSGRWYTVATIEELRVQKGDTTVPCVTEIVIASLAVAFWILLANYRPAPTGS